LLDTHSEEAAMAKRYRVELTDDERADLELLTRRDATGAKVFMHARILLLVDQGPAGPGWTGDQAADALGVSRRTVENTKRRLFEGGMDMALQRKRRPRPATESIVDGEKEARLIAVACSPPPDGRKRWTVRLLAEHLVVMDVFDHVSKSTVQKTLKKTSFSLTGKRAGKSPPSTMPPL
jgi:transposase